MICDEPQGSAFPNRGVRVGYPQAGLACMITGVGLVLWGWILPLGEDSEFGEGRGMALVWPARIVRSTRSHGDEDA